MFYIFTKRPAQSAVLSSRVTDYKHITPVDQSEVDFVIHSDTENYMDIDIHMSLRGKLVSQNRSALDPADSTTVGKDLLHSLFVPGSVT